MLVHAWAVPRDPVVIALRYQAEDLRDALHARWRKAASGASAASRLHACQ